MVDILDQVVYLARRNAEAMDQMDDQDSFKDTSNHMDKSDDDFLLQGQPEELRGSRLGDMRVRIELPRHSAFRRVSQGVLEATKTTNEPHTPLSRTVTQLKRVLI